MADKKITRRLSIFINGQEVDNTLSNIRKNLTKFRAAANRATEGTEDWKKYNKIVAELETELDNNIKAQKSFRKAAKETASGLDQDKEAINNFTQSFGELFQGIKSGDFSQIQNGFSGIKSGIVGATKASLAFIATPIGAAIAGLFAIGVAAKKWIDYNAAVVKSLGLTKQITQLTDGAADQVRVRGEAISEIFGLEFQGTLEKARALVKKFGISYDEAFDVIQDNLIRGQKNNDEFFQSLDEYAVFFSKAQFTADEFGKVIAAGYDLGFYNDKLPDAIKEFALTIEEQTQPAKDALINAFGPKFTKQLLTGIRDGSISVKDALAQISEEANKAGLNVQQQQQLTADLFKGAGEDAGGALKIFEAVNIALNEQTRALSESEQITQDQVKATTELKQISSALFVSGDKGFGLLKDRAKLFLTEGIIKILRGGVDLINWFIELNNTSAIFSGIIQTIGAIATAQFEIIMSLLNNAKLGFSGLGDIITGAFTLDPDKISEGFAKTNAATALFLRTS